MPLKHRVAPVKALPSKATAERFVGEASLPDESDRRPPLALDDTLDSARTLLARAYALNDRLEAVYGRLTGADGDDDDGDRKAFADPAGVVRAIDATLERLSDKLDEMETAVSRIEGV